MFLSVEVFPAILQSKPRCQNSFLDLLDEPKNNPEIFKVNSIDPLVCLRLSSFSFDQQCWSRWWRLALLPAKSPKKCDENHQKTIAFFKLSATWGVEQNKCSDMPSLQMMGLKLPIRQMIRVKVLFYNSRGILLR
jgi:hypothetical protein